MESTLDRDGMSVRFETSHFSTYTVLVEDHLDEEHIYEDDVCTICGWQKDDTSGSEGEGSEDSEALPGSIRIRSATLNLLDKVAIIYRCTDDQVVSNDEDVTERGVLIFDSAEKAADRDPAQAVETVVLKYDKTTGGIDYYKGTTEGIDARDMDKSQFAVAYMKLKDGTYIFGTKEGKDQILEYSPLIYCQNKKNDVTVGMLCRAMMHYGAAAQVLQYGKTSGLMSEGFDTVPYEESVLGENIYSANGDVVNGMELKSVTMDLQGAISYYVRYTAEDESVAQKQIYAEYEIAAKRGKLTDEIALELQDDGRLRATISGVPAKDMGATLTVKPYYLDDNENKVYGGELVYSGYEYVRRTLDKTTTSEDLANMVKALAMYIHYANAYGNP